MRKVVPTGVKRKGTEGVVHFAQNVESPRKVGNALGEIEDSTIDQYLLPAFLRHSDNSINQFLGNFVFRRFWTQNLEWVDKQLNQRWQKDQVLAFLLQVPSEPQIWHRVEKFLENDANLYWKEARINPWTMEATNLLEAAEKLTSNGQPVAAIDCFYLLSHRKIPIPIQLASAALLGSLSTEDHQLRLDQHHVVEVIKWLQENTPVDSEELFKIEWNYLPLLNRQLYGGEPKVLEHKLALSPKFFCEVIAAVFSSDKENKEAQVEVDETQQRIAQNAYSLLHGWRIFPGSLSNGSFDGSKFTQWLEEVKKRCKESGHFRIAMDQLGQALAHAPQDPGGLWIHKSIAAALDSKDVPEMRRAFTTGLFNKRGVHGFSQGEVEKQIAASYREKAKVLLDNGFTRVSDAVRSLAEDYERDAEREARRDIFD